jgi:hypothetical protein
MSKRLFAAAGIMVAAIALTVPGASAAGTTNHGELANQFQFLTIDIPGAAGTQVGGVNDAGVLTGSYQDGRGRYHGFIMTGSKISRFDPPGSKGTFPSGINDQGTAAGSYVDSGNVLHGFLRCANGAITVVNDPMAATDSGHGTGVETVNDHGVVVGAFIDAQGVAHGFVKDAGHFTTINFPHASNGTILNGINDSGVMTGWYGNGQGGNTGFVDTNGRFITFTAPGVGRDGLTNPFAISRGGVIAGLSVDSRGVAHGWFLRAWHFVALNDPKAGSSSGRDEGTEPYNIDERGDTIVGEYVDDHGNEHGFMVDIAQT